MIIYHNTAAKFFDDVVYNRITTKLKSAFSKNNIFGGSQGEVNSWNNSLQFMKNVLDYPGVPSNCEVAIEYSIPQTSKRVDFMLLGQNQSREDHVVIVELKQWAKVEKVDDISKHSIKSDLRGNEPVSHPSYQAFSYKSLILNYCDIPGIVQNSLNPCAYLHNMTETYRNVLEDDIYSEWIEEAPVFLQEDVQKLRAFIEKYITAKSSNGDILYKIDFGKIRPSKALQDSLDCMLCGNKEFMMIDEQAVAYDFIMRAITDAHNDQKKHVVVISGGPGTGKSVLAVNVLADSIRKLRLNASYITKNATPRNCYRELLARGSARRSINLQLAFLSPHSLPNTPYNSIDVGIFDEAHRMQMKPYMYKGEDMLKDAINAARVSVFFVDDDQRIAVADCYNVDKIYEYAKKQDAVLDTPEPFELTSQFRCSGSNGYIAFLNDLLGIKETANKNFDFEGFDLQIFDTPEEMKKALEDADQGHNKSRMCAGYCYDWNVKNGRGEYDIVIGDFKAKWNLIQKAQIFAVDPDSFNEVGCIHTVQGMEFDYVGVIIGNDLKYKNNKVISDKSAISKDDKSSGIRGCKDEKLAERLIKNTYKVLMTRGQKGCYIYCEDESLREYLRERLGIKDTSNVIDIPEIQTVMVRFYEAAPAAGPSADFGEERYEEIELPASEVLPGTDFVLQVNGNSMEPEIMNGELICVSWKERKNIKNGDIGIFNVDGAPYCKHFYQDRDGNLWLVSANEELQDTNVYIPRDSDMRFHCRGKVLGHSTRLPQYFNP